MAMFSKRHYEAIGAAFNSARIHNEWAALGVLMDLFEKDNPRFSRTEFIRAVRGLPR